MLVEEIQKVVGEGLVVMIQKVVVKRLEKIAQEVEEVVVVVVAE